MPYLSVYVMLSGRRIEHQVLPQTLLKTLRIVSYGNQPMYFDCHKHQIAFLNLARMMTLILLISKKILIINYLRY